MPQIKAGIFEFLGGSVALEFILPKESQRNSGCLEGGGESKETGSAGVTIFFVSLGGR